MVKDLNAVIGILSGFAAVLIWAGFPVVTELAFIQSGLSVSDLTAIRFLVSGTILLPFVFRIPKAHYQKFYADFGQFLKFLLFVSGSGAPYILIASMGIEKAQASHFGIIVPSSMMIFTAIGAKLWLAEPIRRHTLIGNTFILLGIAVIAHASISAYQAGYIIGDMLLLLGGLLWSGFTLTTRYFGLNPWHSIALVSVSSALIYLPYYFLSIWINGEPGFWQQNTNTVVLQAVYQGLLLSIVALVFYSHSIARLGAAKGSLFAAGLPGLTLILTSFLPNQPISVIEMAGAFLVSVGMLISLNVLRKLAK